MSLLFRQPPSALAVHFAPTDLRPGAERLPSRFRDGETGLEERPDCSHIVLDDHRQSPEHPAAPQQALAAPSPQLSGTSAAEKHGFVCPSSPHGICTTASPAGGLQEAQTGLPAGSRSQTPRGSLPSTGTVTSGCRSAARRSQQGTCYASKSSPLYQHNSISTRTDGPADFRRKNNN